MSTWPAASSIRLPEEDAMAESRGETRYLIVGGGMAGHAAAAAVRELDPAAPLALIGAEPDRPYARPPLTKGLWLGKAEESVWLPEVPGLALHLGRRAVGLDLAAREVRDDAGGVHRFDRLLLATGGAPRRLPSGDGGVVYLRTLADQRRLRAAGRRVAVVGGGFIGTELAAAMSQAGKEVTLILRQPAVGAQVYPADLAAHLTRTFREKGVRVLEGRTVTRVEELPGGAVKVRTDRGDELEVDVVAAGLGIAPDTGLAEAAGIRCADGILVDARLETSARAVFAAGDAVRFDCPPLGGRVRVEHEDAALSMGRCAGRNMAGLAEPYTHLPFFYSDLFDLGYEAVGRLDARLETVASWKVPFREGVVYYLEGERVRGVLLWGIFEQVDAARALIEGRAPASREALAQAIPT
jgi:3-phenylpropionate/trans-cinnamate dioxygenase ferredoxin reductase component